jgi:5'-methylthioadenosine phosphorylase
LEVILTLAIIGGTGLEKVAGELDERQEDKVKTPYGEVALTRGRFDGGEIVFLARHGLKHDVPPHLINYRANIRALKDTGVTHIMAAATVGSLKNEISPGDFILLDQFIDFTKTRLSTYSEKDVPLRHTDMTEPYDGALRRLLLTSATEKGVELHRNGTYVCTEGPRFETPAEINMFRSLGGDVVGMTGVPEVVLANELEIPYAALAVATNYAAGLAGHNLTYEECADGMEKWMASLLDIFIKAARTGKLL